MRGRNDCDVSGITPAVIARTAAGCETVARVDRWPVSPERYAGMRLGWLTIALLDTHWAGVVPQ